MKRWIKHFLLFFWSVARRDARPKIFFYHDVGTKYTGMGTPSDVFWAHMKCLAESVRSVRGVRGVDGEGHVVAFDDGYRGIWDERERFAEMDIAPIVFIAIALVGQPGFLTWDEIRTLQNDYGFTFQCHTWAHQTLVGEELWDRAKRETDANGRVTAAWYQRELIESKVELERQLNLHVPEPSEPSEPSKSSLRHEVTSLCLPVGYFNDEIIELCHRAGYERIYSSIPGNILGTACLDRWQGYVLPRCLCQSLSAQEFKWVLNGGMLPLANRYFALHYHGSRGKAEASNES